MEESTDLTNIYDLMIKVPEELDSLVNFNQWSKVLVIGSPWVMTNSQDGTKMIGMTAYNIIVKDLVKVERQPIDIQISVGGGN